MNKAFDMDGEEHRVGDINCCNIHSKVCLEPLDANNICAGIVHYKPVYGGYSYKCDKCGNYYMNNGD